jgi:hypothetical protein
LPPPPSLLDTLDIPSRWSTLIRRCLEREPAARFPSILEARDAIAIASGRKLSRRAALAAVGGAGALAAAVGLVSWKRTPAGVVTPTAATVPASPPALPPIAPSSAGPAPSIRGAEPPPTLAKTERAAPASSVNPTRPRRPPPPTRSSAKPESGSRAAGETRAADGRGQASSIADTDQALDPFRESR